MDSYRSTNPKNRRFIERARHLRSETFHNLIGSVSGAITAWMRTGLQRLKCWRTQYRAEQELRGLNSAVLRDIGVSRSEIPYRVREALPCG
jgi:uncharacterized protein YjiS (DUF1127 family)